MYILPEKFALVFGNFLYYNLAMSLSKQEESYLQELSQHLYNLQRIIEIYCEKPIDLDNKKLSDFYLEEIDKLNNTLRQEVIILEIPEPIIFLAENLILSSYQAESTKKNVEKALNYLSENLLKVEKERRRNGIERTAGIEDGKLKDYIKKLKINKEVFAERSVLWITKSNNGDYLFDGSLVYIKNKESQYVKVLDSIVALKPNGGEISYQELIRECKSRGLSRINKKKILRSVSGDSAILFKNLKDIKRTPSFGIPIIEASQKGDSLKFNNTKK